MARSLGPIEAKLDDLWSHWRSRWRRLLSKNALREISLRASFDTDLLLPADIENQVAAGLVPDCERCTNTCCAGYENVVSLRLRDVALLIDVGRTEVIAKHKPRFPESLLDERPALRDLMSSMLWRTLPVLRQEGPLQRCSALGEDMKCTLHPHWPTSCERFPYTLSVARRAVVWGTRCQSKIMRPEHRPRSGQLFEAALAAYNERVKDAVLLTYARPELDELGVGEFLSDPEGDPFGPPAKLPVLR